MRPIIVIPAYKPAKELIGICESLVQAEYVCVVVDDGSGAEYSPVFESFSRIAGIHLLKHYTNLGKGAALKTGINYAMVQFPGSVGVVTADADGQHKTADIIRIAKTLQEDPKTFVLGARSFSGKLPWRSAIGNKVTRSLFNYFIGCKLTDTQTGLRGIPTDAIASILQLSSGKYEYEFDMLIQLHRRGIPFKEVPIETVYVDGNKSSHFNPLVDSLRIYFVFFRFLLSSISTVTLDNIVFAIVMGTTSSVLHSMIAGRICSIVFNFMIARKFVFHSTKEITASISLYLISALIFGSVSFGLIVSLESFLGMNVFLAKVLVETSLFFASFAVQRTFIFAPQLPSKRAEASS